VTEDGVFVHFSCRFSQVVICFKYQQANSKKIALILNIEQTIPQFILADSVGSKQILVQLSNAVKFTNFGEFLKYFSIPSSD
jgi:hypothetical protein